MTLIAFSWPGLLANSVQLILCLAILVVLHEFGHYITARWFGCRVEKFYLFFNPWFSLWKKKIGETEFGIGWIPFGGYVILSGEKDQGEDEVPKPWALDSKPAWQRLIIMLGGIVVNLIFGLILLIFVYFTWGREQLPVSKLKYGLSASSLAGTIGIRDGDIISRINGTSLTYFDDIQNELFLNNGSVVQMTRNGIDTTIRLPKGFISKMEADRFFLLPRAPIIIAFVSNDIQYSYGVLYPGDRIVGINNDRAEFYRDFEAAKQKYLTGTADLTVIRQADTFHVGVQLNKEGSLGIRCLSPYEALGVKTIQYNLAEAISAAFSSLNSMITTVGRYVVLLFTSDQHKSQDSVGCIFSLGTSFGGAWSAKVFWIITVFLSIWLGFFNLLPIPGLDGGHAGFALFEMITGRRPGGKIIQYVHKLAMVILLALTLYGIGLDIYRALR